MIDFSIFGIDPLQVLILLPAIGAVVVGAFFRQIWIARIGALAFSLVTMALAIVVFFVYQNNAESVNYGYLMFSQPVPWFEVLGSQAAFGIDGISAAMILLTGILSPLAILVSWEVTDRAPMHLALLLRALGDVGGWQPVRAWGGLLNAVAILWFMGQMAYLAATTQKQWDADKRG